MVIHVAVGDITQLTVDAIVSPSNSLGIMIGGIAGQIREAGGPTIEEELRASAPIAVGAAVVTGAGDLFCKNVIHVPTMEEPGMKIGVESVRRATRAALLAAARYGHQSIAFPAIGAGVGGVPFDEAVRAIVDELRVHRQPTPQTVWLMATRPELVPPYEEALRMASQP
jgi:O-acetyl-ADP-ribose deacetylase (regulator of RNase III)